MTDEPRPEIEAHERAWEGIISPEPPSRLWELHAIMEQAEQMLATRKRALPKMAHDGDISWDSANGQIATFELIVADWRWLLLGEGEPSHCSNLRDRKEALDKSIQTIAEIATENALTADAFNDQLQRQAQLVIAMRWWLNDCVFPHPAMTRFAEAHRLQNQEKGASNHADLEVA